MTLALCHHCGAEAAFFHAGDAGVWSQTLEVFVTRPREMIALCLPHARARGWPNIPGERQGDLRLDLLATAQKAI